MEDGELPEIDFSVNMMQSAQVLSIDGLDNTASGFHAARAGLNASVQFSENVSGLVMLESEPNDFGSASGASQFQPQVDFFVMNLQVNDGVTLQAGTPVTGLLNFRGFSDGPAVQGNPLIGNSPADNITAGQGVKLIGSFEEFGFDLTVNKGFGEVLSAPGDASNRGTGLNYIGKVRYTGTEDEIFQVGAGLAFQSGEQGIVFAQGDGENYNLNLPGQAISARNTHAALPAGGVIAQADAKITPDPLDIDLWGGFANDSDVDATAVFGGVGAKVNVSENFYLAGRFTVVNDQSDDLSGDPDETLTRFQGGIGWMIFDRALLKVEGVTQSHGDTGITRPADADNFGGVLTELSFNF
ncbi:MAG: hypothetical protein V5A20_09775 [Salinibacter sp.]|uniref:hypothetical protein n=1 Tax=Salinibacter sp. TaxID=2065818 RepID=UPI002FC2D993